jgi:hypothetical protein
MRKYFVKLFLAGSMVGCLGMTACSTGMEASRPVPVDLSQFHTGDSRFNVVSVAGAPQGSITDATGPCDIYKLYTTGLGGFGKGVVTAGETITDIGTLGLAEIIWTPVQAGTRPREHTVMFCYDKDDKLVSVLSRDPSKDNSSKFAQAPAITSVGHPTASASTAAGASSAPATGAVNPQSVSSTVEQAPAPVGNLANEVPAGNVTAPAVTN